MTDQMLDKVAWPLVAKVHVAGDEDRNIGELPVVGALAELMRVCDEVAASEAGADGDRALYLRRVEPPELHHRLVFDGEVIRRFGANPVRTAALICIGAPRWHRGAA